VNTRRVCCLIHAPFPVAAKWFAGARSALPCSRRAAGPGGRSGMRPAWRQIASPGVRQLKKNDGWPGAVHRKRKLRARAAWPLLRDRLARSRGHCIGTRFWRQSGLRTSGALTNPVPALVAKMSRQWMDCVCDATKQYDIATHSLNNIMFLNTSFLALNVHFERTEVVFQIPSSVQ